MSLWVVLILDATFMQTTLRHNHSKIHCATTWKNTKFSTRHSKTVGDERLNVYEIINTFTIHFTKILSLLDIAISEPFANTKKNYEFIKSEW